MPAETFEIRRAERRQARLRLAVCAASGGGKTWTSLELAFGIVDELLDRKVLAGTLEGKVGMIDTERRSGQLYAHLGAYDTIDLGPPYTVERYVCAMQALERAGCAVIILDSISHAWAGAGGVLALLDRFEDRQRFSAFGTTVNPAQDEFVDAMLRSPCHVIATMRSKTAWVLEDKQTRSGSIVKAPRRIGLAPVQRPGIEYEFTTLVDLDTETHKASVVKNRCPVFQDWAPRVLTREHGRQLAAWLLEGAPDPKEAVSGTPAERAAACRDAALRAIERAATVPDLARVFENAQRTLRSFPPALPADAVRPMLEAVVEAKDGRKATLSGVGLVEPKTAAVDPEPPAPDPAAAGPMEATISAEEEGALRALVKASGVGLAEVLGRYSLVKLALMRRAALVECRAWLEAETAKRRREPALEGAAAGVDHFADLKDDLPWVD